MEIPRREFLKLLGLVAGATGMGACDRFWSVPDHLVELALRGPGLKSEMRTACGLCEAGCGLTVRLVDGVPVGLTGNPQHPLSRGGLCPVGQAGLDVLYAPGRLQGPLLRDEEGRHVPTTWEQALSTVSDRITSLVRSGSAHRIVFLNGEPGQLLDDLCRHFMATIGSPNYARPVDAAAVAYSLTQGLDRAPGFDLGRADLVLSFGQDLFEEGSAPLFAISAMIGSRADGDRAELIHVGTRLSPTAGKADFRVRIQPGTHGAFALGVAQVLVREGRYDSGFVADHTYGFEDGVGDGGVRRMGFRRHLVERYYPDRVAQLCGCDPSQIIEVARRFGAAEAPLAIAGGEVLRESNATWSLMAAHALNALRGVFNRPGGVVLPPRIPLTPMPPLPEGSPDPGESLFPDGTGTGLTATDPLEALTEGVMSGTSPVDLLFVLGWNPVFENPGGGRLADALSRIPTVVSLTPFLDETAALADLVLPASLFLESWQCSTTPSTVPFGTIGMGSPVVEALFETRHPGDAILELGRRTAPGTSSFSDWPTYEAFLRYRLEGLALAGQGSVFEGALEEAWVRYLENRGWRFIEQQDFETFWADLVRQGGWWNPTLPASAWSQMFPTPSGRYEFWSIALERRLQEIGEEELEAGPAKEGALPRGMQVLGIGGEPGEVCLPHHEAPMTSGDGPLRFMAFKPMTSRGSLGVASAMLLEMFGHTHFSGWETWGEMAPETAEELGLGDGDVVQLETEENTATLTLRIQPECLPGVVQMPMGLGRNGTIGPAEGVGANPIQLLSPARDPLSGAPALNGVLGRVTLVERRRHGRPAPSYQGHES